MQYMFLVILVAYASFKLAEKLKDKIIETRRKKDDNVIYMDDEKKKDWKGFKDKIKPGKIFLIVVGIILFIAIQSSFFTVDQTEYAFLTTLTVCCSRPDL